MCITNTLLKEGKGKRMKEKRVEREAKSSGSILIYSRKIADSLCRARSLEDEEGINQELLAPFS